MVSRKSNWLEKRRKGAGRKYFIYGLLHEKKSFESTLKFIKLLVILVDIYYSTFWDLC